jgi:hypothetical protein
MIDKSKISLFSIRELRERGAVISAKVGSIAQDLCILGSALTPKATQQGPNTAIFSPKAAVECFAKLLNSRVFVIQVGHLSSVQFRFRWFTAVRVTGSVEHEGCVGCAAAVVSRRTKMTFASTQLVVSVIVCKANVKISESIG